MVFVKVREVYDLHTVQSKMSIISIHTPKPDIIIRNYPGLLMQCKAYRPHSCNVTLACASTLPVDPAGVGTSEGDIAPEDMFNPILYKATSNFGMSQIEGRILAMQNNVANEIAGSSADFDNNSLTPAGADEFSIYYGLLSDTNGWKHAMPQAGLSMTNLKPLVYEMVYNVGENNAIGGNYPGNVAWMAASAYDSGSNNITTAIETTAVQSFRGSSKPMPWLNCTYPGPAVDPALPGFTTQGTGVANLPCNKSQGVPYAQVNVGCIIVPPSRLHELYYRMVVEWTLEFSGIRSINEITDYNGLSALGNTQHYKSYDYAVTSKALGVEETKLSNDTTMVSTNADIEKVM